jgi:hypothetical protein
MSGPRMVAIPPATTFCADCAAKVARTCPETEEESWVTVYCPHNKVGGVFLPALREWQLCTPIDEKDFVKFLYRQVGKKIVEGTHELPIVPSH